MMLTPADHRWLHAHGIASDASEAREDGDPQPMVDAGHWSSLRDNCDHATLRAISAEHKVEKLEERVAIWRTVAIVALTFLASVGLVIGMKAAGL